MARKTGSEVVRLQPDLFDSPLNAKIRTHGDFLSLPFFDPNRTATRKHMRYVDGDLLVEVKAVEGQGIATIYDRDLLLYIGSLIRRDVANGNPDPGSEVVFSAYDYFKSIGRDNSTNAYKNLANCIERLKGTLNRTTAEFGPAEGEAESEEVDGLEGWFNWLESGTAMRYRKNKTTGERRLVAVRAKLNPWLYKAILQDERIIQLVDNYFALTPIERRFYDLARAHCNERDRPWVIDLEKLRLRVGSDAAIKEFRQTVGEIVKANRIPGYQVTFAKQAADGWDPIEPGARAARSRTVMIRCTAPAAEGEPRRQLARIRVEDRGVGL